MRALCFFLIIFISITGCTLSPNSSAVPFLWNDEPSPESYQVMVVSDLDEEALVKEVEAKLDDLGFIPDFREDGILHTEPNPMKGNVMKLTLDISDNMVIITGFQGLPRANTEDIKWKPVFRGEEDYGPAEWELMNVFAQSLKHSSILYN